MDISSQSQAPAALPRRTPVPIYYVGREVREPVWTVLRRDESLDSVWEWKPGLATPSCTSYREENAKQLETVDLKKAVLTHSYGSFTLKMDD
jgi:hypothetical protein